jgi:hypothetical protein
LLSNIKIVPWIMCPKVIMWPEIFFAVSFFKLNSTLIQEIGTME